MIAYLLICTGFADSLPGGEFCETLETPDSLPRSLGTLGTTCQAKNRHPPAKFFCLRLRVECENRDMTFRFQIEGLAWWRLGRQLEMWNDVDIIGYMIYVDSPRQSYYMTWIHRTRHQRRVFIFWRCIAALGTTSTWAATNTRGPRTDEGWLRPWAGKEFWKEVKEKCPLGFLRLLICIAKEQQTCKTSWV